MTRSRVLAWSILVVLIVGAGWIWWHRVPATAQQVESLPLKDHRAPDFTLETVDGGTVALSDLRGHPVVLNFWATWCPPCRAEMPELQAAYDLYSSGGLVVLGVNQGETQAQVQAYRQELGLTFPIALDRQYQASERYAVNSLPTTFFIDREGIIRTIVVGQMNAALLKENLKNIYP